jgi:hypothetical protein
MLLISSIYIILAIVTLSIYGSTLKPSILDNISTRRNDEGKEFWECYMMQFLFLIVIACHIPYVFFSGKESLLIIIDETMRKSISKTLEKKLARREKITKLSDTEGNTEIYEEEEDVEYLDNLAYKSMNPVLYYLLTALLFGLEMYLGIVVKDITTIFGYIGTIAGTGL